MVARRLFGVLGAGLIGWGMLAVPATADPIRPDSVYRIFWEPYPGYRVVPASTLARSPVLALAADGADQWRLLWTPSMSYEPTLRIQNTASGMCLRPVENKTTATEIEQGPCNTVAADSAPGDVWLVEPSPSSGSYSITYFANRTFKMYANKAGGNVAAVVVGAAADTTGARWILTRV
ncbi:hypothetical protein [Nocardia sp. NPDC051570]|uniref:hypothetical protein n=1 Tax=Nocardia sp. NPDC051570 TaxID=3364324 RepID=UPI00378B9D6B